MLTIALAAGLYALVLAAVIHRHKARTQRILEHALILARLRAYCV